MTEYDDYKDDIERMMQGGENILTAYPVKFFLEFSTNTLTFVNAGHNPPLLRTKGGTFQYLQCRPGFVLASLEGIPYQQDTIQLEKSS